MEISVVDVPERHQYEAITADGTVAGFAAYSPLGSVLVMTHTEVDPAYEGHGIGSTLIQGVLDDIRAHGRTVRPDCPFVQAFLSRHPDYQDLAVGPGGV